MPAVNELYEVLGLPYRIEVLGAPIDPWTMSQTVKAATWLIEHGRFAHLIGVNADKLLQMRDSPEMDSFVRQCEVINADGASMVMAAERLGKHVPERVAGVDLMQELCKLASEKGFKVYLLGAKAEVVRKTVEVLESSYRGIRIIGFRDGYFSDGDYDSVFEQVNVFSPDLIFVGITSPKKERLIEKFRELGATGVFVGVGGSFDVISGMIPRAPVWMQKARLEWLFRMAQEPKRLLKRYLVGNSRFLRLLFNEVIKQRTGA